MPGAWSQPVEVKALLMNNGDTDIDNDPFTVSRPSPASAVVKCASTAALAARCAAWDDDVPQGALSFGFVDVATAWSP